MAQGLLCWSHMQHRSIWHDFPGVNFPQLDENLTVDTCVIGAGIVGLSVAYQLLKRGLKVAIVDRFGVGEGETGLTSAHLSSALDDGFANLKRWHGLEGLRKAFNSHNWAIVEIEKIAEENGILCDFKYVDGYTFLDPETKAAHLTNEMQVAKEAGGLLIDYVPNLEKFNLGPALKFPRQAQFHPLKYLIGLTRAVSEKGAQIFAHTAVKSFSALDNEVTTEQGYKIRALDFVVASNVPINDRFKLHTKLRPNRTYIVAFEVPRDFGEDVLLWDTADPYHYVRFYDDEDRKARVMIVGGEDHKVGQEPDPNSRFEKLIAWTHRTFPAVQAPPFATWSGQIIEPDDGLAFIGRNPGDENIYICTGDSGHGLTHGTIAGRLICDLITRVPNPWEALYDPSRLTWRSAGHFLRNNLNTAIQYTDYITAGHGQSVADISEGQGAILSRGLEKEAVYRDESGVLHRFSAVCPHMKCIVQWNAAEKTWDCPCHGSRFDRYGQVLNGPALSGLKPIAGPGRRYATREPSRPSPAAP